MKINKEKIDILTARLGLSSTELAEKSGIPKQYLSTIKSRGTCNPKTVSKISKALKCDVSDISE